MNDSINLMIRDDGVATIYDDTYDITIHCESEEEQRKVVELLKSIPSAQPEIVRCKDCKWKQGSECVRFAEVRPFPDDFCSRAERRTDG